MSAVHKPRPRWVAALFVTLVALLVGALIWWVIKEFVMTGPGKKKRAVQEISLLKPPPPTPPPKVEPPKVVPPKQEIVDKQDVPKPDQPDKQDAPPPGPDLAVDAQGGPGSDGFGLVGKKGGGDLIGSGAGGTGSKFAWYGALVKERIQDAISRDKKLRAADYRILVNVWINSSGKVTRVELIDSTANAELDNALKLALRNIPALKEGAPGDMPQPVKLRITAR